LAFGEGKHPKGKKRGQKGKKQKPPFERIPVLHEESAEKGKAPVVPDMIYPVQPARKSFLDFPPGIGWI